MKFDFLSRDARQVVVAAQRLARGRGEEAVELEHLLHALCDDKSTIQLLRGAGTTPEALRARLDRAMVGFTKVPAPQVYLSERVLRLFDVAQIDARERGRDTVLPVDLLRAIPLETRSSAAEALRAEGLTLPVLEGADADSKPPVVGAGTRAMGPRAEGNSSIHVRADELAPRFPQLARYARDLTALAREGKLSPVIGRHGELRRMMQILGRRSKNSPILVGDPGVGKSALVEGLAQRIASGDVPDSLRGRHVFAFDVGALVAGAKFRGEFEERVRGVIAEARDAAGEVLLFVDEIHTLVGAGKGEGSLDAASLLKPALARGEIALIGATTPQAYRQHIEKDAAFERRFAPIMVAEPTLVECLAMLRGARGRYEDAHRVGIDETALEAAVKLAARYVRGRALPDKAFDLLDEAAARLRLELESHPDELDALLRKRRALQVELAGLERMHGDQVDPSLRERLTEALAALDKEFVPLEQRWQAELRAITLVHAVRGSIEEAVLRAEAAEKRGELELAARTRYGELPGLYERAREAEAALRAAQGAEPLLEEAVKPVHIARVVEDWTGIPVGRMLESERDKVNAVEQRLRERVIGQDEAVRTVGNAVKRARAGLSDPGRPIGSFLFLGPTGVGKTELAKALAEFLFDDEHALVRLDMSEFMEKHAAQRLTGAPPGYVGYEEGGQLTEAVRRRPYAVVLLDEVEKAHPDVFNVLLALLDDGRLTDSSGRTVGFENVVLIMTSNLGAQAILDAVADAGAPAEVEARVREAVRAAVAQHFRPEFINRVDETVIFRPLGKDDIARIVELQLRRLRALLTEQKLSLELGPGVVARLAEESYDPAFGARPVKRILQRRLRDPLAEAILAGRFAAGSTISARLAGDDIVFT